MWDWDASSASEDGVFSEMKKHSIFRKEACEEVSRNGGSFAPCLWVKTRTPTIPQLYGQNSCQFGNTWLLHIFELIPLHRTLIENWCQVSNFSL